jgi:hypothetical protein
MDQFWGKVVHPAQEFCETARSIGNLLVVQFAIGAEDRGIERCFADIKPNPHARLLISLA